MHRLAGVAVLEEGLAQVGALEDGGRGEDCGAAVGLAVPATRAVGELGEAALCSQVQTDEPALARSLEQLLAAYAGREQTPRKCRVPIPPAAP